MTKYKRLLKDCFWDSKLTSEDIDEILSGQDQRRKEYLFGKILLNSTHLFSDLKLFELEELEILIKSYTVPKFNSDYINRRINLAAVYFLNDPLRINELKWMV